MAGVVTLYSLSATRRETVTRPEHLQRLVEAGLALLQGTNRIGKGKRRADLVGALVVVSTVVFALGVIGPASSTSQNHEPVPTRITELSKPHTGARANRRPKVRQPFSNHLRGRQTGDPTGVSTSRTVDRQ